MNPSNGQEPGGSERLDRIEKALELILDDHSQFREEHKILLNAQVLMHGGMQELRANLEELRGQVAALVSEFRGFVGAVEHDAARL
jgi:hypothetical protein